MCIISAGELHSALQERCARFGGTLQHLTQQMRALQTLKEENRQLDFQLLTAKTDTTELPTVC